MIYRPSSSGTNGFTLLEMLIVLAIISIMLIVAIPSNSGKIDQVGVSESVRLMRDYQQQIASYYAAHNTFPTDNKAVGMPAPSSIVGNYLSATYLEAGALHLKLGNKISAGLHGKFVTLRPVFVPNVENTPVSWICGNDTVPASMIAAGKNRTNVETRSLPITCR